ncbi:MAG: hypothetical protein NTV86_20865, partial [Planctomycetota bacterium]|nr:hypothetical protein [Planctomycetota bacterium]
MSPRAVRTLVYLAVAASLAAVVVFSAVTAVRMADAALAAPADRKAGLARLAWVCVAGAALAAVAMAWVVMRLLSSRLRAETQHQTTEHVDAWKLSGQRFQMTKEAEDRL